MSENKNNNISNNTSLISRRTDGGKNDKYMNYVVSRKRLFQTSNNKVRIGFAYNSECVMKNILSYIILR